MFKTKIIRNEDNYIDEKCVKQKQGIYTHM